ncbi:MAG: hypothetical protein LBJ69_03400 [Holosporales bacterium]|nr:hypothetical protein [Holosporales bacterium]
MLGGLATQTTKLNTISKDIGSIAVAISGSHDPVTEGLKQRVEALEELVGHPAIVQEPEVVAGEEDVGEPGEEGPVVVATPPTIIPATGIYLHIENLLCPYIEQQRLRWDLKEWAQLPDWMVETIATTLCGKRIAIERYGDRSIPRDEPYSKMRWTLYAELTYTPTDRIVCISCIDWEAAYAIGYGRTLAGNICELGTPRTNLIMTFYLKYAYTLHVGMTKDVDTLPDADDELVAALNVRSGFIPQTDPTPDRTARIPKQYAYYKKNPTLGPAFLKIDVLPESEA